jgi:hypothetical protein
MPFGARSSCANFERFSKLLNYCINIDTSSDSDCDQYLDDFIFIGRAHTTACHELLRRFITMCDQFGVPLAHEKQEGPTTTLTYLGLVIDTEKMEVRVPQDKVGKGTAPFKEPRRSEKSNTKGTAIRYWLPQLSISSDQTGSSIFTAPHCTDAECSQAASLRSNFVGSSPRRSIMADVSFRF